MSETIRVNIAPDDGGDNCRMYENKYPEAEELVVVTVNQIAEMGAYCSLLEYNNIEGMIPINEVSRRRIRSMNKILKVGRTEIVLVLRVDRDKGYIDLSLRRVSPEDQAKTIARYTSSKTVHSIMRHVADKTGRPLEELYKHIAWPLYKKYPHALQAFQLAVTDPDRAFTGIEIEAPVLKELLENIRHRLTPQPIRIRSDIEVMCFSYEGVTALKRALKAGEECSTEEIKINVKLVAPPLYVVLCTAFDKESGLKLMERAVAEIKKSILESGGKIEIKVAPRVVSANDDTQLSTMFETLRLKAQEVDGDNDRDDDDSESGSGDGAGESKKMAASDDE